MIASVQGTLQKKSPETVVVAVNGIGMLLQIPLSTFYSLPDVGDEVFLQTHMIFREDLIRLFGFFTEPELDMFKVLIDVNRIGPKLALSILSGVSAAELHSAVLNQDFRVLTSIPGIGKKSAERILFEVRDKLEQLGKIQSTSNRLKSSSVGVKAAEVVGILVNLGYKQKDAENAVEIVLNTTKTELNVDEMIRSTLNVLAGR